ncbi:MAG: HAMP domain-containing sensor histidine kinase [Bacteroidales bacterium]|nr:HAMP domain-containing sensor histidine kinase [Bacteroidales bacterium]
MEKRIKALYIITIIAILAFLGMQVYWVYGRYEFSLKEYERNLEKQIASCVDDYDAIREKASDTRADSLKNHGSDNVMTVPVFSLQQEYGDTVRTTRTARIYTYLFSAHELLGLEPGTPLTNEQKNQVVELAQQQMTEPADSVIFDASGAKDENEAWLATKHVQTERKCPFTTGGIDSVLNKAGIKALTMVTQTDSMVWKTHVETHKSVFNPELSVTIPYSQLEGKTVTIVCPISPAEILPGMWHTLIISILVSALLIVCLVSQISTVLKLSRLDRMRNSFITTMIHELKRPISTLKMCVSGLDNGRLMEDTGVRKEILYETRRALDNLSSYFSKLRDITFNDVEQIPLNLRNLNLHDLFDDVAAATTLPSDKSVVINNHIDKDLEITADSSHLYNMINNLVENAVKYSGPAVEINATATGHDGNIELCISDNGNGIPAADIKHIFRRFYRGKASEGTQPGMGLGLAYVKLLVEAHGGDISVESALGKGSCFTIKLPQL